MKYCAEKIALLQKEHGFDSLAVTGSSGMMAGAVLGMALQLPVIFVRKDRDGSHGSIVEAMGEPTIKKYLIVDDFICTGASVARIVEKIEKYAARYGAVRPECVGAFLYNESSTSVAQTLPGGKRIRIFR